MGRIFLLLFFVLVGCAGEPAVADISQDKVLVHGNGANQSQVLAEAQRGCGMFNRGAVFMSQRCMDQYCIQKAYLFACTGSAASGGGGGVGEPAKGGAAPDYAGGPRHRAWLSKWASCKSQHREPAAIAACAGPEPSPAT
jgi:hypothetical protein